MIKSPQTSTNVLAMPYGECAEESKFFFADEGKFSKLPCLQDVHSKKQRHEVSVSHVP